MPTKITRMFLLFAIVLSSCTPPPTAKSQIENQITRQNSGLVSTQTTTPADEKETQTVAPALVEDPLSSIKGKIVKDENGYLLLLGFVNSSNSVIQYGFTESYQFPHEHIMNDVRILDGNGTALEFDEVDPGEMNLYLENPLGENIFDPRVFRILQKDIQGPVTFEMVNLVQRVDLKEQSDLSFSIHLDTGFPLGKNEWDINQSITLIPDHPFTIKYFDATIFNVYAKGKFSGSKNTFFNGTYYLEASGFEGISFSQIVPADRQEEWPNGWGGSEQPCAEMFPNCIMSDAGLLKTQNNAYDFKITVYSLIVHGPWQVQFDLP